MDRYEMNVKLEQIKKLMRQKNYAAAANIADTIDFYKIKEIKNLSLLADAYEASGKNKEAKDVLIEAYSKTTLGRQLAYRLVRVCIKTGAIGEAEEFYEDFLRVAPRDNSKYILQYELATAKGEPIEKRITILETYLADDMDEKWSYELAKLYHKAGLKDKCVRMCDDVILWFNDGKYVDKAMELKMLYKPLSKRQQEKYEERWMEKSTSEVNADEIKVKEYDAANKYNTVNIQDALKESIEVIMNEEGLGGEEEPEKTKTAFNNETAGSLLSHTVKDVNVTKSRATAPLSPNLEISNDGQLQMSLEEPVDDQIEGQMTLDEMLENYEKREKSEAGDEHLEESMSGEPSWEESAQMAELFREAVLQEQSKTDHDYDSEEKELLFGKEYDEENKEGESEEVKHPKEDSLEYKKSPKADEDNWKYEEEPETDENNWGYEEEPETDENNWGYEEEPEADENNWGYEEEPEADENNWGYEEEPEADENNWGYEEEPETEEDIEEPLDEVIDVQEDMEEPEDMEKSMLGNTVDLSESQSALVAASRAEEKESEEADEENIETIEEAPKENDDKEKQSKNKEVKAIIKEFIEKYSGIQGLDRQLLEILQKALINGNTNIVVMGEVKSGKTALGIDLIKIINKIRRIKGRKVAKINAEVLNDQNIAEYLDRLKDMDIIIERAGFLKEGVQKAILKQLKENSSRVFILEAEKTNAENLLNSNKKLAEAFSNRVVVKQKKIRDWVAIAKDYAADKGYAIDEMGMLALHARIDDLYAVSLLINRIQVEQIIDSAMARCQRRGFGRILKLFGKEREKLLKEEDFN